MVLKRNNKEVEFDKDRIVTAIEKAMLNTAEGIDSKLSRRMANQIHALYVGCTDKSMSVEYIQDLVEERLMNSNRKDVARNYILYREGRSLVRSENNKYKLLDDEFISEYKSIANSMTPLGEFVYYRTYSRWLAKEKRREFWWETCRRAVEFNCNLVEGTTKEEAQDLFDNMFYLRQFLSGRTLWSGGTSTSYSHHASQFNCSFTVIDNFNAYKDICYLLMLGVGVGFSVEKEHVNQLPMVKSDVQLIHKTYLPVPKHRRKEVTEYSITGEVMEITIGDSKIGWAQSVDYLLRCFYELDFRHINVLILNYDNVRPFGEPLKTFGGKSSGHEALLTILDKTYKILTKDNKDHKKLKPIDAMDIANIIAEGIVVGGVRRSAQMCLFDSDDKEIRTCKSNLYIMDDKGVWSANKDIIHRMMSNNSIAYYEKPSFEELCERFETIKVSAEGNFFNMEVARKRKPNVQGTNPCFTGDMKLLTKDGYKTFKELSNKPTDIINYKGDISTGKVWSNGIKDVVVVKFSNKETIKCTKDHVFMLDNYEECKAQDLKKKTPKRFNEIKPTLDLDFVRLGFLQGDGNLTRLNSTIHKGIEVNIGKKDDDIFALFDLLKEDNKRSYYITEYNDVLKKLGFDASVLPIRKFPSSYDCWTKDQKASFITGCYSANGSIIKNYRIAYKATSKEFISKLQETLKDDFGVKSYITTNKSKTIKFENGSYLCKESYDLNISSFAGVQKFSEYFTFIQIYKIDNLVALLNKKIPYVISVKDAGREEVFDFNEPITHWGVVNGVVVHNCGEILLNREAFCNLTTINAMSFVIHGILDRDGILNAQRLSARAGYRNATVVIELPHWNKAQEKDRLIGCSLTGWQDMCNATNMSKEDEEQLMRDLRDIAVIEADLYADHLGLNKSELKTTVKPEGTLSLLPTVSAGVHVSHSPFYIRRIRINSSDPLVKVCEELGYPVHPENGQDWETCKTKVVEFPVKSPMGKTKYDTSAIEQLETYKSFMENYVEHNASNTISVRANEWDGVVQWVYDNWDSVIGITFMPLDDSFYQLLPYEAITEEEYDERSSKMKPFIPSLISKYEIEEMELDAGETECVGACPLR